MERPNWAALQGMVDDLSRTIGNIDGIHREMLKVTGVAWSEDRLVKATVGPRGQLIELEIDPRVYRRPNSKALAASILATVREAVADAARQNREIMNRGIPADLRTGQLTGTDFTKLLDSTDAELVEGAEGDERA